MDLTISLLKTKLGDCQKAKSSLLLNAFLFGNKIENYAGFVDFLKNFDIVIYIQVL